jgi:hypothetical protein
VKTFTVVDWISLVITEHAFIFSIGFVQDIHINRSDLLNECNRLLLADSEGYPKVQPGTKTGPTQCRGSIGSSSRSWESFYEPIAVRTNIWRGRACRKITDNDFNTFLITYRSGGTPSTSPSQGVCRTSGPLTEGPGPTSSPGSLLAPRVACRCSRVGFDR